MTLSDVGDRMSRERVGAAIGLDVTLLIGGWLISRLVRSGIGWWLALSVPILLVAIDYGLNAFGKAGLVDRMRARSNRS
jgi:hypothetical protein